jgi:hypothetical protein
MPGIQSIQDQAHRANAWHCVRARGKQWHSVRTNVVPTPTTASKRFQCPPLCVQNPPSKSSNSTKSSDSLTLLRVVLSHSHTQSPQKLQTSPAEFANSRTTHDSHIRACGSAHARIAHPLPESAGLGRVRGVPAQHPMHRSEPVHRPTPWIQPRPLWRMRHRPYSLTPHAAAILQQSETGQRRHSPTRASATHPVHVRQSQMGQAPNLPLSNLTKVPIEHPPNPPLPASRHLAAQLRRSGPGKDASQRRHHVKRD